MLRATLALALGLSLNLTAWAASDVVKLAKKPEVSLKLEMLSGRTPTTQGKVFTKLTVTNSKLKKSFHLWCSLSGSVENLDYRQEALCRKELATVSHDDDEALSVGIERTVGARRTFTQVTMSQTGDGTMLANELKILGGEWGTTYTRLYATHETQGEEEKWPAPLELLERVGDDFFATLDNRRVRLGSFPILLPLGNVTFDLDQKLGVKATIGYKLPDHVRIDPISLDKLTLLNRKNDTASGLLSADDFQAQILTELNAYLARE